MAPPNPVFDQSNVFGIAQTKDTKDVLARPEFEQHESFQHTPDTRKFVSDMWQEFLLMYQAKMQPVGMLGGRNLISFWNDSNRDYSVITGEANDPNDPVQQYVSTVSRDKADVFISNLVSQLAYPSVRAFNTNREIDRVVGRMSRSVLEWMHLNDGYPSENGHQKMVRLIHKGVVEGTSHVLDDVNKDDGLTSTLVPNEEIFIPNFWQPDLQKQSLLIRMQLNVTYENAEAVYGSLPNFKYCLPGIADWWFVQRPEFKSMFQGIVFRRRMQIMHTWKALTREQIRKEIQAGRLESGTKRAKYYNVIINDIPMYPVDNLSPYKDGLFPMSVYRYCHFAMPEFYWGNSLPNKIRQDKVWLDAWKTLIRFKGKMNALPPLISLNGNFVDEEILLPAKITPVTEELQLRKLEGVADPVSQADVMLMQMAEQEIDRGSVSPQVAGQLPTKRMTKGEMMISDANAKKLLDYFSLQVAFFVQSRSFPLLKRAFQFFPRGTLKKLCIPEQTLWDGTRGNLEIVFKKIPKMTVEEMQKASEALLKEQVASKKRKEPSERVFIDPEYARNLNLYVTSEPGSALEDRDAMRKMEFNGRYDRYLMRPDLYDAQELARQYVRMNEDPEELLAKSQPVQAMPTAPIGQFPGMGAQQMAMSNAMEQGGGMSLPGGLQDVNAQY
jgi:hypothetical protein